MRQKKIKPRYVPWAMLSPAAMNRLLTAREDLRPKLADIARSGNRYAEDGSSWKDYYALAGFFPAK